MHFSLALPASLLALTASARPLGSVAKRAPIDCEADPSNCPGSGPSGTVVSPIGGTEISQTSTFGGDGQIPFNYTTVWSSNPFAFTQNVNISLVGNGQSWHMAALTAASYNENIEAYLITPPGACGTFQLVVTEQQFYENYSIQFQSAAPTIIINCSPHVTGSATVYTPTTTQSVPTTTATTESILTGVTRSSESILTGVTRSSESILTGVTRSSESILTGVVQSTDGILTGVVQSTDSILTGVVQSTESILTGVVQETASASA